MTAKLVATYCPLRTAGRVALIVAIVALSACSSQRSGDFGRQQGDYISKNVFDPIDRRLMSGGKMELSRLPLTDDEQRMYDVVWRFYSAPYAKDWSAFGAPRVSPLRLKSGEAFENTDGYYAWLRRTDFKSSGTRFNSVASHVSADVQTAGSAFAAICTVKKTDAQRKTASAAFPELGEDERLQVQMRLEENRQTIVNFAMALDYRYQSYSYALKRLVVETPDEKARAVDDELSALRIWVDAAQRLDFCTTRTSGPGLIVSGNFG